MRLRELELFGFKSFADRTRIPLPDDLLVVVGPNGSGKSNVADAILWAVGEQSAKSLRGRKMKDVIFSGSRKRAPSGMAEVFLVFEDSEGAKVRLGRRLTRAGESTYLMEGRPVRLKDVHDFLTRYAISTQGSFLVEQGRVEALLGASPEERRMIFEEVAGIAHYKENRRSAMQKLEAAQANLLRLNDVIMEVEGQMKSLKRQARKADRYIRLSEELRERRRRFWGRSYAQFAGQKAAMDRDLAFLVQERERRETLLTKFQAELERGRASLAEHESSLQALIGAIHEKELASERAEQENKRRTDQILAGRQRLRQIESDAKDLKKRLVEARARKRSLAEEEAQAEGEEKSASRKAELAQATLVESRERRESLVAEREALKGALFSMAQEHSRLAAVLGRTEDDLAKHAGRERALRREEQGLSEREEEREQEVEGLRAKQEEAEENLAEKQAVRQEAEGSVGDLRAEADRRGQAILETKKSLAVWEGNLQVLRADEAALASSAHHFLRKKAPDRTGDTLAHALASVPEEMVPPLSALLGDLLEGYPAQEWRGLPDLLGALRKASAGQATFFLENHGRLPAPLVEDKTGFLGWLHQREDLDEKVRQVLPTAALVTDEDTALAFARTGIPAVSKNGVFVHPDGWVRGGAGGGGGASLLELERRRKEAEGNIAAGRKALRSEEARAKKLEIALEEAERQLEEAREAESSARRSIKEITSALEAAFADQKRLAASRSLLEGEMAQAQEERVTWEGQREELTASLEVSQKKRAAVEREVKERDALIEKAGGALEAAHEEVAASRTRHGEAQERLRAAKDALGTAAAFLDQLELAEKRLADESAALDSRIRTLTEEVTAGGNELAATLLSLQEDRDRKTRFEEDLSRLQDDVRMREARLKEAREALEQAREEASALQLKLASVATELRTLMERIGEEFEEEPAELADAYADEPSLSPEERQAELGILGKMESKLSALGGVNMLAREEYEEHSKRFQFLAEQRADLEASVASLQDTIRKINRTTRDRFMEAFTAVGGHFARLFKEVFEGGVARLSLLDEANPLETGVEIYAQPPEKKLQSLQLLSGGEKAMVALALLFSLFRYRPQPFFILDEVDAPLDEANINRFNRLLTRFQGQTQFIVVSHNKRTMELAQILYGVTMAEGGVSKLVSVKMDQVT